jgi:hypothetical protein
MIAVDGHRQATSRRTPAGGISDIRFSSDSRPRPFILTFSRLNPARYQIFDLMQVSPFNITYRPIPRLAASFAISAFRAEFFLPSRPTIISGCGLPAVKKWFEEAENCKSFSQYLRDHASTSKVEVELRNLRTRSLSRVTLPYSEAITLLNAQRAGQWPSDTTVYIAQSSINDLCNELASDLPTPRIVRETARGDEYGSSLWMGFPPTSTPLHHDPNPNFFIQMAGMKRFRLLDPPNGALMYQAAMGNRGSRVRGAELLVGEESQQIEEWLWGEKSPEDISGQVQMDCFEACLSEEDGIFIPLGWWHSVRGIGNAASINASVGAQ